MISVIIPIYNKEKYVIDAIQSVLNQTYQHFELILLNDGSKDNSLPVVEDYLSGLKLKNSIQYNKISLYNRKNCGVSTTRNQGAEYAKYNFLAFLDADDWWEPDFLSEMIEMIQDFPEASVWGTGYNKIRNNRKIESEIGLPRGFYRGYIDYFRVYATNFYYMPLWIGATIIKKDTFIIEKGFRPFLKWGEDFDFWIRIALNYKIAFLNKHLSNYNHDVDNSERAMNNKLHPVEHDFLFHTGLYANFEATNPYLKLLFDKFRTYSLLQYYLDNSMHKVAKLELDKVNWKKQPLKVRLTYSLPVFIIKLFEIFRYKASRLKTLVLKK